MKNQILTILTLSMGLALVASLFKTCKTENDNVLLNSEVETLHAANNNLQNRKIEAQVRVDTLYKDRWRMAKKYDDKIKEAKELPIAGKDSLNKLLYPTIDSANATYYHCLSARDQLAISDSIIAQKDVIISIQDSVNTNKNREIAIKDSTLITLDKKLRSENRKKEGWKWFGIIGWGLNLVH